VRVTEDERDELTALAAAAGQPLALWMHDDLLRKRRRR
jgi:hypothetical protein